jgi:hypothetical protein
MIELKPKAMDTPPRLVYVAPSSSSHSASPAAGQLLGLPSEAALKCKIVSSLNGDVVSKSWTYAKARSPTAPAMGWLSTLPDGTPASASSGEVHAGKAAIGAPIVVDWLALAVLSPEAAVNFTVTVHGPAANAVNVAVTVVDEVGPIREGTTVPHPAGLTLNL